MWVALYSIIDYMLQGLLTASVNWQPSRWGSACHIDSSQHHEDMPWEIFLCHKLSLWWICQSGNLMATLIHKRMTSKPSANPFHIADHLCGEAASQAASPHRRSVMWRLPVFFLFVYLIFMSWIVLYFLHSTSVLSFHIDVVLTLSICQNELMSQ